MIDIRGSSSAVVMPNGGIGLASNKDVHDFAIRWLDKYHNPSSIEQDVENGFGDQCRSLGFEMDGGKAIKEAYPKADPLSDSAALQSIINKITDVSILGSAIFSNWRFITHWCETGLLTPDNRDWFISALSRLAELTAE